MLNRTWWRPPSRAHRLARMLRSALVTMAHRLIHAWSTLHPHQQLALGFASYVLIGTLFLSLPSAQQQPVGLLDNLYTATSAVSTTGLTTVSCADAYTFVGELVVLVLFQLGGIGYMTLSSLIVLARGKEISDTRFQILKTGFTLPSYFVLKHFLVQVVVFTFAVEFFGALLLWWRFALLGVESPLWFAIFHSASAFATAGFSLSNSSLEPFRQDWFINLTIALLCYLGAIGFIVVQDVWYSLRLRERMLTFTSKVILSMTALILLLGTTTLLIIEPSLSALPLPERVMTAAFQVMTASSTAGFNTIPIGSLAQASLLVIIIAMLIGASPAGTGGGLKTTTVSALLAVMFSTARGQPVIQWLAHQVPPHRVIAAVASATHYLCLLALGTMALSLTQHAPFLPLVFEATSAIGTVGLSMGLTTDLTPASKVVVIILMFAGRVGPITLGLALLKRQEDRQSLKADDLAV